jgi:hypothetical protein
MKNVLNEYFEKIFIISSFDTLDRLENLIPHMHRESVLFEIVIAPKQKHLISCIEGLKIGSGATSLISANESIIMKSKLNNYESVCVLEDDIFFVNDYSDRFDLFMKNIPDDWEVINSGFHTISKLQYTDSIYHRVISGDVVVGSHIMSYRSSIYDKLLDRLDSNKFPMDWFLEKNIYTTCNSYVPVDVIFMASSYRNYEPDKNEPHKYYRSKIDN